MCEKRTKCTCGYECSKSEMVIKHEVVTETVPKHDYNDLTPSRLIEYEDKRRFLHLHCCPKCDNVLIEEKGILF